MGIHSTRRNLAMSLLVRNQATLALACAFLGTLSTVALAQPQPYCATRKTETVQTLASGTHLTRKFEARECRDSQGRTRREISFPDNPAYQSLAASGQV